MFDFGSSVSLSPGAYYIIAFPMNTTINTLGDYGNFVDLDASSNSVNERMFQFYNGFNYMGGALKMQFKVDLVSPNTWADLN